MTAPSPLWPVSLLRRAKRVLLRPASSLQIADSSVGCVLSSADPPSSELMILQREVSLPRRLYNEQKVPFPRRDLETERKR